MKTKILMIFFAILLLLGFFFVSKQIMKSTLQTPVSHIFTLVVKNNKLVLGATTLTVNQNDRVVIKITADVDEELHLHGYNKHVDLKKNQQVQLAFIANISGRFPYELENTKTEIGVLEVAPK